YAARVTYDVYTGPRSRIGPLTIVGNQETSEQVVRQMLPFLEGSLYRQDQIFEAQRNLYNLEIFTYAEIRPDLDHEPDSIVPLRIQVNEGDVHRVRAGAGWNNGDCLNSEARWISRNFRGGARRLQLRGRISNVLTERFSDTFCNEAGTGRFGELNWLLALDFSQPWIFSARNSLNLGIYGERQSLKNIYVREAVGATAGITRNVGRAQTLTVGWEPELSELEAAEIFFCTGFQVCEPDDIAVLSGANWLSPVRLSYSQDRRDQVLNPTEGYSFSADLEHASTYTGSNYAYHRAVGEVNGYWSVDEGWVVAGRVRAGWLEPLPFGEALGQGDGFAIAHPEKRFYAGGSNSVRGYAENQLGPQNLSIQVADLILPRDTLPPVCTPQEVLNLTCDPGELPDTRFVPRPTGGSQLLEGNLEFRFPFLGSDTQAVVFLDYGYVWPGRGRTSLSDLKFTPGLGFRYFTPIGPLRIDVGYQIEPGERIQVVTEQLRPVPADDPTEIGDTGFAASDRLALLQPRVLYDSIEDPWDLGRFQVHFSLGQAF
ncbi:MAG: BamA/OMP85 family outer membrane protein, partial [Gemmatimonadota bacterium]